MKFTPRHDHVIGRLVVRRSSNLVIRPDETKVSKFLLIDAVGEGAAEAGIKPGDVVLPVALGQIVLDGVLRPIASQDKIAFFVTDYSEDNFVVQTETGDRYVPFDSADAAKPLGAAP